jgi:DNA-binding CsgD family transcriptional regulator
VANPHRVAAAIIAMKDPSPIPSIEEGGDGTGHPDEMVAILAERRLVVAALTALLQKEPGCRLIAEAHGTTEVRESLAHYRPSVTVEARVTPLGPLGRGHTDAEWMLVVDPEDSPEVFVTSLRKAMARSRAATSAPRPHLSEREREILAQIARGRSVKEVARDCAISAKTVGNHVSNIRQKVNLHTRGQLVLFAVEQGLTSVGPASG